MTTSISRDQIPALNFSFFLNFPCNYIFPKGWAPPVSGLMKQALCYRKTTISLKSCFLWLTSTATVRTSHLSFPSSFPLSVISSTLLAIFSIVSHAVLLYACPPIRQGPVATGQSEPRDNKDVDGPGSEITGHRKWATGPLRPKRWTESQSWLKGWKQFSASRHGDAVLTYGHCGHVMNFQTDSTDEKRRRDERKGGCLIMPMSFGSLIPNSLKTKRPCLDISQANISINMQYSKNSRVLIGVEVI